MINQLIDDQFSYVRMLCNLRYLLSKKRSMLGFGFNPDTSPSVLGQSPVFV